MRTLTVALTGASGYIASHVAVALASRGYEIVGVDNFANSSPVVVDRVAQISEAPMAFAKLDIRDTDALTDVFAAHDIHAVIHLAGLKAVGESIEKSLSYYDNNVGGSLSLLKAMQRTGVERLVFSSSATVYDPSESVPLHETGRTGPINPYGRTKLMVEQIIEDVCASSPLRALNLRYFNPVGAHKSALIGEDPRGVPNNLMPFIMQVAAGRRSELEIFGDDYPTPDGTCIRDYIHVCDLADGHVAALDSLDSMGAEGDAPCNAFNLGTGVGSSVYEVLHAAERAADRAIPHRVVGRRAGDTPIAVADPSRANELLGWRAKRTLDDACIDHWRWQHQNPQGFADG